MSIINFTFSIVTVLIDLSDFGPHSSPALLSAQSRLTLCDPVDCSPPDSSVRGISQARILEWVAISFSRASSRPRD